jgi:pimeloyl-ACP methyl ester carboxylesterase
MRGHGDTEYSEEYDFEEMSDDIQCLIEEINFEKSKIILIGMSLGGLCSLNVLLFKIIKKVFDKGG